MNRRALVIGSQTFNLTGVHNDVDAIAPRLRARGFAVRERIEDAASRGATWIEAYPHTKPEEGDAGHFRGPRSMYEARGFEPVEKQERFTVMRRRV